MKNKENTGWHSLGTISVTAIVLGQFMGCAEMKGRIFLDSSSHQDNPPEWVVATKTSWEVNGRRFFKATQTVRGSDRISGCYDLVRMDAQEILLTEIASDIRGSLDNAQQSISENTEVILGKVRSTEFSGRITGLRFTEQYFERYQISDSERINCFAMAEINLTNYNQIKRSVLDKIEAADPALKDAIRKKQIQFFGENQKGSESTPSRETAASKGN